MRRNLYIAAFVGIILVACIGGFVGGRILLERLQGDFASRNGWTPAPTEIAQAGTPADVVEAPAVMPSAAATEGRAPTSTIMVVPAPVTDQPRVLTPVATWTAGVELPTLESGFATETPIGGEFLTPEPSATAIQDHPFALARSVRYSSGDCPGSYALGIITDQGGNPLPGIRLGLVDEYGNAFSAVSKSGPGDTGRYDFPMGGPPRRFFISIVDDAGQPLSPRVELLHDLPPHQGKGCRWVDWRRG
jgi:hypothetical protein